MHHVWLLILELETKTRYAIHHYTVDQIILLTTSCNIQDIMPVGGGGYSRFEVTGMIK